MAQMMECGHAAQGRDQDGNPVCVICFGIDTGWNIPVETPDLSGRTARCDHYGSIPTGRNHDSHYGCKRGEPCLCERSSHPDLPFFTYQPNKPRDRFYCGCWGFD